VNRQFLFRNYVKSYLNKNRKPGVERPARTTSHLCDFLFQPPEGRAAHIPVMPRRAVCAKSISTMHACNRQSITTEKIAAHRRVRRRRLRMNASTHSQISGHCTGSLTHCCCRSSDQVGEGQGKTRSVCPVQRMMPDHTKITAFTRNLLDDRLRPPEGRWLRADCEPF